MKTQLFVGIDLGGKFHQAQVTGTSGERMGRSFRIARGRRGLQDLSAGLAARSEGQEFEATYTVEATQNY
jgi:hypothetical protein